MYCYYRVYFFWEVDQHYCTVDVTFRLDRYDRKHLRAWISSAMMKWAEPVPNRPGYATLYNCSYAWHADNTDGMVWDDGEEPRSYDIGDIVGKVVPHLRDPSWKKESGMVPYIETYDVDPSTIAHNIRMSIQQALKFDDLQLVAGSPPGGPYGLTDYGHSHYAFQNTDFLRGRAKAYVKCIKDVPRLSDNMLQNLAECFSILYSFASVPEETSAAFTHHFKNEDPKSFNSWKAAAQRRAKQRKKYSNKKLLEPTEAVQTLPDAPNALKSAWLSSRYEVNTTVMDGEQAWDYFWNWSQQLMGMRSDEYKCHGPAVVTLDDSSTALFQCTCVLKEKALRGVSACLHDCYMKGLEPNAYVLWDFVPFSFVVDWFVPFGDALEGYTLASHFTPEYWQFLPHYDGRKFCYSVKYKVQTPYGQASVYTRWYESSPPDVEAAYFLYDNRPPEANTVLKRTIDGIALFGAGR